MSRRLRGIYQCRNCWVNLSCSPEGKVHCVKCGWELEFTPPETPSDPPDSSPDPVNPSAREFLDLPAPTKS